LAVKLDLVMRLGAKGVVMDGPDPMSVRDAVAIAQPDAVIHQMTAINPVHAGRGFSNAKAKRELDWHLLYPSWRQGFKEELA
jgi:hypothetical protein